jgi:hypothetical protein
MATLKESERRNIFSVHQEQMRQLNIDSPVLKTRWKVSEITPAYDDNDGWYHSSEVKFTWLFDTKEQAQEFIDTHEPEKGYVKNFFSLTEEYLREFHEKRWVSY